MYLINKVFCCNVFYCLILFSILSGCKSDNNIWLKSDKELCELTIEFPIGSNIEPVSGNRVSFLPNILSMVTIDNIEQTDSVFYWCISDYIAVRKKLKAKPLGVLKFRQNGKLYNMVILNAAEEEHKVLQVNSMEEFATQHYAAVLMLQDWFLHADPNHSRTFISWEDEWYAVQLMNSYQRY